jgi:hypothetical protein
VTSRRFAAGRCARGGSRGYAWPGCGSVVRTRRRTASGSREGR